ncbi:PD-(D/E)XK nuclease family protein [Candidatus Daviesbacteria bacterium]|nr:PD-(D/E)XK nuclease family protein [Candidatus Daviesbacteria bacterium]
MVQYKPMARDFIPKIRGYSLSDFHDFDSCVFKFLVKHDLDKKYEIGKGSPQMALGVLLDRAIKEIHRNRDKGSYKAPIDRLVNSVKYASELIIKEEKASNKHPNFSTAVVEFFSEDIIKTAEDVLRKYLTDAKDSFRKAILDIDFCKKIIEIDKEKYVLWGGPDTLEMGKDGTPEIIDYKSRLDLTKGKQNMDMDLMPKLYTLLLQEELLGKGFKKARFKVVFWQDPKDESFSEVFELEDLSKIEEIFKEKIKKIIANKEISFCMLPFCEACNNEKADEYVEMLEGMGYSLG